MRPHRNVTPSQLPLDLPSSRTKSFLAGALWQAIAAARRTRALPSREFFPTQVKNRTDLNGFLIRRKHAADFARTVWFEHTGCKIRVHEILGFFLITFGHAIRCVKSSSRRTKLRSQPTLAP
jgi:hypothetical protein